MATDESNEFYRGPCTCGKGQYAVESRIPDHPYARQSQTQFVPIITCSKCRKAFDLVEFANCMVRIPIGQEYATPSIAVVLEVICEVEYPFGSKSGVTPADAAIIAERKRLGPA